ncbi:MAG: 50S ribosomal protein L4 [Cohaesibacteraceae bacterium]|nr:50S ribosomal protein L4 [Cohaesibacteraceae bacterium]
MKLDVTTLDGKKAGTVELSDEVFGLEPRADILQRMVRYQLLKRMSGTRNVRNRSEVRATGKKMYRQKGTGGARHGDKKVTLFRGGGKSFGPNVRSHAVKLPKKVRALALRHALSSKVKDSNLIVIEGATAAEAKTKALKSQIGNLGWDNVLIIDGAELDTNFALASRNIIGLDVLPIQGINVYDILRREKLVLTKAAVEKLEERFK